MARLKPYSEYKDSGIGWMGDIPKSWKKAKISWLFGNIGSGGTPSSRNNKYYDNASVNWINTGDLNDGYLKSTKNKITEEALKDITTLKVYPENSLIIAMYGATIGKLAITKIEAATNQACCVLNKPLNTSVKFMYYWFLTSREDIINSSSGGGQPNISQSLIRGLNVFLPESLEEQGKIVEFLDNKTSEIASLIEDKERLIELLEEKRQAIITETVTKGLDPNVKMKDSGIEWIGEIPEHWETVRLKHVAMLRNKKSDKDLPYLGLENVEGKTGQIIEFSTSSNIEGESLEFFKGDVLFGKLRPYLRKCIVAPHEGRCTSEFLVLKSNADVLYPEYLKYIMLSNDYIENINSSTYGAKMPRASWGFIGDVKIPLPSYSEQIKIMKKVAEVTNSIYNLQENINLQISKLKEYRESLIYEAVTGKIDLRSYNI